MSMSKRVDPSDLIDGQTVAELMNFANRNVVSVYRSRHPDFPRPIVDLGRGRPMLWLRSDVELWIKTHEAAG